MAKTNLEGYSISMGDVVSSNIGSTFESAFKHDYSAARRQQEIKNQPTEQQREQKSTLETSPSNDVFLAMKVSDLKPLVDIPNQVIVDTVTNEPKTRKDKIKAAAIIGGATTVIAGTTLLLTKGNVSKGLIKFLSKHTENLTNKIETIKSHPHLAEQSALKLAIYQKLNKGIMMARGLVFNITPFKDVLFDKVVCDKLKLRKPCNAITNGFRRLSLATVKSNYKKTGNAVEAMTSLFSQTNKALESGAISGAKPVSQDSLKTLNSRVAQIRSEFTTNFSEAAVDSRDKTISRICKNLNQRVYRRVFGNLKNFIKDVKSWTTFIPEAIIEKDKSKFLNSILEKKRIITNSPQDNFNRITQVISNIEQSINPSDKGSRELLSSLKKLSQKYINVSGINEATSREEICSQINLVLKKSKGIFSNKNYTPEESNKIYTQLNKIGEIINTDKKGLIEELLTNYKEILPPEEYNRLKATAQKTINKINNATFQEGNEYVDKVRDLTDGSALTDVALSMALPLASTSVAISAADTKEKKQSVALKYGIPIVTGALTATIATVKLVAGGKSLALGLASTFVTNQICDRIDKKLKENSSKKQITA